MTLRPRPATCPIRRPVAALALAGALVALAPAAPAQAGAWTLSEGAGQLIATASRRVSPTGAMVSGIADEDENGTQIFVEYGILDGVTGGLRISTDYSMTDAQLEAQVGGHLRLRLWTGEAGDVLSAQAGVLLPIERWLGEELGGSRPGSVPEVDLRVLYGRGWQGAWGDGFVSSEFGMRWRGENRSEEVLLDVTGGFRPFKRVLGLLGLYSSVPVDSGGEPSIKLAPSLAYTLWPHLGENDKKPDEMGYPNTVQLGLTWDLANPEDGLGVTLGIWQRF